MQLTIALDADARAVEPSGQPRTARRWFSNWLVSAPSIVQWPELCTRGAISFASSSPSDVEQLDREHADVVELVEQRVGAAPRPRAWSASSSPGAGARRRRAGCRRSWWFSTSGQHAHLAVAAAHRERSRARGRTARTPRGSAARRRARSNARVDVGRRRAARPGPCRRSRRGGSSAPPAARPRRPRRASVVEVVDRGERRRWRCRASRNVCLLGQPVLRDLERARSPGRTGSRALRANARRAGGHAFPLVGDDVGALGRLGSAASSSSAPTTSAPTAPARARPATGRGSGSRGRAGCRRARACGRAGRRRAPRP